MREKQDILTVTSNALVDLNLISSSQSSLLVVIEEQVDEYGFIIENEESKKWRCIRQNMRKQDTYNMGRGYHCKSLCKYLPHVTNRGISVKKNGYYYCIECEIAMKCGRCRCCGRVGRSAPRQRRRLDHPDTKFIE